LVKQTPRLISRGVLLSAEGLAHGQAAGARAGEINAPRWCADPRRWDAASVKKRPDPGVLRHAETPVAPAPGGGRL